MLGVLGFLFLFFWLVYTTLKITKIRKQQKNILRQMKQLTHKQTHAEGWRKELRDLQTKPDSAHTSLIQQPIQQELIDSKQKSEITKVSKVTSQVQSITKSLTPSSEQQQSPSANYTSKPTKKKETHEWELLIGGQWLNRIGALAIIIAFAFFVKYSFDHQLITDAMRVTLGGVLGFSLLGVGFYYHRKKMPIFPQGLVGIGVAILYVSIYAAYNFYALISFAIAFILMCLVTTLALQQAMYYNSLAVALLGWTGGYLTPFLISTSQASSVGLFSYLFICTIGMMWTVYRKNHWRVIYALTIHAVAIILLNYIAWHNILSEDWMRLGWILLFWGLFMIFEFWIFHKSQKPSLLFLISGIFTSCYFFALTTLVTRSIPHYLDVLSVVLTVVGALYLWPLLWKRKTGSVERFTSYNAYRFGFTFIIMILIVISYQFNGYQLILLWSLFVTLVAWWSTHYNEKVYLLFMSALLGLNGLLTLIFLENAINLGQWHEYIGTGIVIVLMMVWIAHRSMLVGFSSQENHLRAYLHASAAMLLWILCTVEWVRYFPIWSVKMGLQQVSVQYLKYLWLAALWITYALPLFWLGFRRQVASVRWIGWFSMILGFSFFTGLSFATYQPLYSFIPVFNGRFIAGIWVVVSLVYLLKIWRQHRVDDNNVPLVLIGLIAWIGLQLISRDIVDYYNLQTAFAYLELDKVYFSEKKWIALCIFWGLYSLVIAKMALQKKRIRLLYASWFLLGIAYLSTLMIGMDFQPIEYFVPVLNFRFGLAIFIMAVVLVQYLWIKQNPTFMKRFDQYKWLPLILLVILSFQAVHIEVSTFYEDLRLSTDSVQISNLKNQEQLSLSLSWLFYSLVLMVIGIWRKIQLLRFVAMSIFGIAILKIFIGDLSFLDPLYRIGSFVGLGVILLAVSYLYQRYKNWFIGK